MVESINHVDKVNNWVAKEVYRCDSCNVWVHKDDLIHDFLHEDMILFHNSRHLGRDNEEVVHNCGPVTSNGVRRVYTTGYVGELMVGDFYVNEYVVGKNYGGPEEGGWWYNVGQFVECRGIYTLQEQAADRVALLTPLMDIQNKDKHKPDSVLNNNDWSVLYVEKHEGLNFPPQKPHYE